MYKHVICMHLLEKSIKYTKCTKYLINYENINKFSDERDIVGILGSALMNEDIKLGRGISALVEIFLQVSMLRPSLEQTIPVQNQIRVSNTSICP